METLPDAVAYYRMSSDDQDGSIEQQKKEVRAFAEGKYRIVREYVDAGKSGSKDQEKRVAFRKMVLDSGKGDFEAVLVWKTNRFGRLDSLEGAEAKRTLRGNGVHLVSVKEGVRDWNTMACRIVDAVEAEMDHNYSRSLASDSLRGRLDALERGFWPNGSVPYAYHRRYVGPGGREVTVKRTEAFRKPEGWNLHLVVCEEEAKVVCEIFERLTAADASLRSIVAALNARGVPSPRALGKGTGAAWNVPMVRGVLTNIAYVGFGYIGAGRTRKRGQFSLADDVKKAGVCPVIVDPATFELAQTVLARRARKKRRPVKGSGALSGVLVCAHCGHCLAATHWKGRVAYCCNSASLKPGKTPCRRWSVYEDEILPLVCARLVETVDGELLKALAARPPQAERLGDLDMARRHLADLERQIDQAADRYLRAPAELMPRLEQRLEAMRKELAECEEKAQALASRANEGAVANFARWWQEVRGRLLLVQVGKSPDGRPAPSPGAQAFWLAVRDTYENHEVIERLPEDPCRLVEPQALRALLVRLGVKVECSFEKRASIKKQTPGRGRGKTWVLRRAVMSLEGGVREDQAHGTVSQ
jgi:site-specific DNA recombinase